MAESPIEKLRQMKEAKEAAEKAALETAEKAAAVEAAEARKSELSKEREFLGQQLVAAEAEAQSAQEQVAEAEGYADVGDDAKELIAAIKAEAEQKTATVEGFKSELAAIDAEIAALEGADVAETSEEPVVEVQAEAIPADIAPVQEASPEKSAYEQAQEAYGGLQATVGEKVKQLSIESLLPEAAAALLQELKNDRLALLQGFNELGDKVPLKDGKRRVGAIKKSAAQQFGSDQGQYDSLFNNVNEAIDSIARKLNGTKTPSMDNVITQRGWEDQTKFGQAELAEFLKQAEDVHQASVDGGVDARAAVLNSLRTIKPSRLDEAALQQYEVVAQGAIDAILADENLKKAMDDEVRNLQAGISLAKRGKPKDLPRAA